MEMCRKTIKEDEKFLRQVSTDIDFFKDDYMEYVKCLRQYCKNNAVYALALVQLGIAKRVIYLKNTTEDMSKNMDSSYDEGDVIINPVIIDMYGHTKFLEGCESCLDFVGTVDRPYAVEVEYRNLEGQIVREKFEGFKATVFCHEYDHLNGVLHIDLADEVVQMPLEERKRYRELHPYEIISKTCKAPINEKRK